MSLTWIWIAVMLILALGILALPLLRNRKTSGASRETYDVAIYKDQLKEAEREHERGLLSAEQTEAVKIELHRKLLAAAPETAVQDASASASNPRLATAIGTVLFLSIGSVAIYSYLGSPSLDNLAYADRDIEKEQQSQGDQGAVREMAALVDQLEAKLQTDPENVEGWLMLGRSAVSIGQFPRAVSAYEQAIKRQPDSPQILVDYAESVMFMNEGRVSDDALQALKKARQLNAANPKARYYIALEQAQAGNLQIALQEWVDLLAISLPNAPWVRTVRGQIENAASELEIGLETLIPSEEARRIGEDIRKAARQQAEAQPAAPGPSQEDMEAAAEMTADDRAEMIKSMVQRLADRLKENPDDRQGWLRLANAYKVLGETEKAADAMRQANQLAK